LENKEMTDMKRCVWIVLVLLVLCAGAERPADVRRGIQFPDLPGYETLKCDFHMHTVFSDGNVWPTVRVDEAWREGLDAIALSDHIEKPHKQEIPINHNRPYDIAVAAAKSKNILLIRGAEITRDTPPGHHNAIFLQDIDPLDVQDFYEVFRQATLQKAFIFWNHPGWQGAERGRWGQEQTRLLEAGQLHGIEVCNGLKYHVDAHRYAVEKDLTILGDSDEHNPSPFRERTPECHRTMTLVFARERSIESIREALIAQRTAAWIGNQIVGRPRELQALFAACVQIDPPFHQAGKTLWLEIHNRCELDITLERVGSQGPATIALPALATTVLKIDQPAKTPAASLSYRAVNLLAGPDEPLEVKLELPAPVASATSAAAR
jgi:hypothetical protein